MNQRRKIISRGTALVDPRAAVERLRSFQLAEPLLYVLEIVRAAVAGGATAVDLYNDADDLVLTFDGAAPPADDLAHLLDHLFSTAQPRLRLLAIAVNTALGFGPRHVDLYTTHEAPAGQCRRVRFTAGVSHDPDARVPAALESARVELVARPADLPPEGVRVHLRESFGMPVVREWFARDPAETVLLRDRLVALPIPLRRDGVALPTGFVPPALVSVPLDLGAELRGSLQLVDPAAGHRLVLSELGVILESRALGPVGPSSAPLSPLRLHLDARSLPTNASRSQVDLSGGLQHALRRAWNAQLPVLLDATRARLADPALPEPERLALHESLVAWLHHCLGETWLSKGPTADAAADPEAELGVTPPAVLGALLDQALIPTATGPLVSARSLARLIAPPQLVWRGPEALPPELAPHLGTMPWCPPRRPQLEALLRPLSLQSAAGAVERARESLARRQRFLGLTPREARVAAVDEVVLRAPLGEAAADGPPALPVTLPGLRGELVLRPRGLDASGVLLTTVFIEQRPLPPEALDTAGVPAEVALEHPSLRANQTFQGVESDAALGRAMRAVKLALAEGLAVLADELAGALGLNDPRRQWLGPALDELPADTRRAMVRAVFDTLRGAAADPAEGRSLADDVLQRHPGLAELPVWQTTARDALASTREVRAMADAPGGCVLVSLGPRGRGRADGRTVLLLDAAAQRTLAAMLPAATRFVDLTGTLPTRVTPDPRTLLTLDDRRAVPWLLVTSAHTRVAIAPSPSTKETFTLAHGGVVLDGRKFRGRFGPLQVVAEDDRIVVLPGKPAALPESVPADLDALVAAAELGLVGTLALAWRGDEASADALGGRDEEIRSVPARRMLFAALAHVAARPDDATLGPLREALEGTPMIPSRRPDGAVEELTPAALRARLAEGDGATFPFLAEPPADLAGEDFRPLIVPDREHRAHLERAFGVKLRSAHEQLPPLREARARRLARARLAGRPAARPDDLRGFALGSPARSLSRQDLGTLHAAVAREAASARVEVLVDGVVAFALDGDALPLPVVGRLAPDDDAALTTSLDALSDAGRKAFDALLKATAPVLLEAALDDADGGTVPAAGLASLCLRWALVDGAKGLARHPALRERLRRLPMWRSPAGERISLSQLTLFTPRPAWCRERATPWVAPEVGEEPDLAAVVLEREDDARALGALVGELPVEVTDEVERLQRRRALRASGGAAVRLSGEPGCAALSARVESVAPKLGFGELRLVEGEAALTLRVHAPGSTARVLTLPSPFALSVALACPELDPRDVDRSVQTLELGTRLQEAARALLLRVAGTGEALPPWSAPAMRWALLSTRGVEGAALGRAVFVDTEGRPMSLADLNAQEATHRAVGYCTLEPDEPCGVAEEGVRAVVLSPREAAWLQTLRKGRDLTAAVKIALRALAWDRSPPASRIEPPVDGSVRVRVRCPIAAPGQEGEVCWLDSEAPAGSTVAWHRSRRRLGESAIELPWPARVALEAPELTPDATRTAPVPDLALAQARQRAIDLAMGTLRRVLGPAEREAPMGCVAAHDPKSPAWHGGQANVVGWLWLCADGAPGSVEVTAGERSLVWKARSGGKYPCAAPLTGRLWLHRGARERIDDVLEGVIGWAWRRLLDVWSGAAGIDPDAPAQAVLLTRSALAGALTGATMRDAAKTLRLPGTRTTFQQLQTARKDERALRVVPPGDARLEKAYFVPESGAPWMAVLRAAAMLSADEPVVAVAAKAAKEEPPKAAPAPRASEPKAAPRPEPARAAEAPARRDEPAKKAGAARSAAWPWASRVESELRAMGLSPEMLHAVEGTESSAGARDPMVEYAERERVAKVAVRHPVVARWLAGDPRRGATLLAMATFGAINRARADLTANEECAAMDATLAALAGRQGR